jgi:glutamyl-tRNA reductase
MVLSTLAVIKNMNPEHRSGFYFKSGQNAVDHLFKVASGIDSLIIGEDQIIGQVKDAFKLACESNTVDTILSRMFTKAFEAAKKVKTGTSINQGSASVSSTAVDLCQKHFPDLSGKSLLLIGAGQTGRLVLTSLGKRKFKSITVANRTISRASELAHKYNGIAISLEQIPQFLPLSDIIIIATDAKSYLVNQELVKKYKGQNRKSEQLFIDLSVPRNIDPGIVGIEGVKLYAVDDLTEIVKQTTLKRTEAVNDALKIISQISDEYMDWLVVRGLAPIFEKIKTNFEQVHKSELEGYVKVNGINDQKLVEEYGKHISDKYARLLIRNLRNMVKSGESKDSIEAINELFELAS